MATDNPLHATILELTRPGRGILAADESQPTITKRFKALGIESTEETRRSYRSLLFTAHGVEQYLSGVILFEETLSQRADDGTPLPEVLTRAGVLPGIKVDKGTTPLPNASGDLITQGLDGLDERLIDKLDEALNAADPKQRQARQQEAKVILGDYKAFVANDPLLAGISETGSALTQHLSGVLADLDSKL